MVTKFLNVSTDSNLSSSNTLVASEKAIKSFVENRFITLDFLRADAPSAFVTNQKWFNTSDNKIYTALSNSAWDSGVLAITNQLFSHQNVLYYFDGTTIEACSTLTITEQNRFKHIKLWVGTKQEYDALSIKDPDTKYWITDEQNATLATQTEFNNSSTTTASTPYQVNQALGNYLSLIDGGILAAGKTIGLTGPSNQIVLLSVDNNGTLTITSSLNISNETNTNSLVVRSGNVYKVNTSGAKVIWSDSLATAQDFGIVKPDGTTIVTNNGILSTAAFDTALDSNSTNAVQNKTLYDVIGDIETLINAL